MTSFVRHLYLLLADRKGNAAVEMALSIPLLAALLLGGVEVTRYILVAQKLEKVAITISDVATQSETISATELDDIILAAGQVMRPYSFGANGYVIISSVTKDPGTPPRVNWQYQSTGDSGSWTQPSQVGVVGADAVLPSGFTMADQENIIISEVYYNFTPIFGSNIFTSNFTVYKTGFFRPRLGSLTTLSMLYLPGQPQQTKGVAS